MDVIEVAPGQPHTSRECYDGSGSTPGDLCGEKMRVGMEVGSVVLENARSALRRLRRRWRVQCHRAKI